MNELKAIAEIKSIVHAAENISLVRDQCDAGSQASGHQCRGIAADC